MQYDAQRILLLIKLLSENTSQRVIQIFLQANNIPKSFKSWDTLYDERISSALISGRITEEALHDLLEDAEEHGKQHVFLYKCDGDFAKGIIRKDRIKRIASEKALLQELNSFSLADIPESPEITNIRFESIVNDPCMVIKIIEKRESRQYLGEEFAGGLYTKTYKQTIERGVNSIRLRESGLLEIRIASHKDSANYIPDIARVKRLVAPFITIDDFTELSLKNCLKQLSDNQDSMGHEIRYSHSDYTNDDGVSMSLASKNENSSLSDNLGATSSLDAFKAHDGYVEGMNIWFRKLDSNRLGSDIHTLLTGMINEFTLPAQCTKKDYEHVLNRLIELNS